MDISLVITTCQREHLLAQSLDRLLGLTRPRELIVVDDGGEDGTADVVRGFMARSGIESTYIYTNNPGTTLCSHARNIGLKRAKYEYLVTSEPELWWRTDVLAQFTQLQPEHHDQVISAGRIWFAPDGFKPGAEFTEHPVGEERVGWVAPFVAMYRRDWLLDLGGWDESFPGNWGWDDTDLLTRLRISGHGQHIATEVEAIHLYHGLGSDPGSVNEQHFIDKNLEGGGDLVANRGVQWGVPIPRPA